MRIDLTQYRETFFEEASDHLSALEAALLQMESGAAAGGVVDEAFRAAHTIKGAADAVGFPAVSQFAHGLESLLARLRGDRGRVPRRVTDLLLQASDALGGLVAAARTDAGPPPGVNDLLAQLARAANESAASPAPAQPTYIVTVRPDASAFHAGLDPLRLLAELGRLGTVVETRPALDRLPRLADLDPERCELGWTVRLQTDQPPAAIEDVFGFTGGLIPMSVQAEAAAGSPPSGRRGPGRPDPVQFAAHLVRRGVIPAARAVELLELRQATDPKIGRMALDAGLMTVHQLFDTLDRMEGFGQTAVRLGYLTEAGLTGLLRSRAAQVRSFGDVLIEQGVLTPAQLQAEKQTFLDDAADQSVCDRHSQPGVGVGGPSASFVTSNAELLAEFCTEAEEHLEAADRHLLTLNDDPTRADAVNAVYRGFHTIKGAAGMLNLAATQALAHEAEGLLNLARDGQVVLRGHALDAVFASADALKRQIAAVRRLLATRQGLEADPSVPQVLAAVRAVMAAPMAEPPPLPTPSGPEVETPQAARPIAEKETVRVDRDRFDKLINAIGELVIAQSMVEREFADLAGAAGGHSRALPELNKIARDLQGLSLSLRMVPLQGTFQKMTRLVRDLSRKVGKPVRLDLHGEETELDKTVVDQLGDPLMHMVRNAVDHGLEPPADRLTAGKPAEGRLTLRGFHQGGSVFIELADDGRGLDREAILRKAVERGLVADGQVLSDAEVYALIFEPGFSTAKAVTDVSGRGVGMDVVRRNVEALQGSISIRTRPGQGTTFTVRLPLTLAIMDGLTVGVGGHVYVLPLLSVVESFRPRPADVRRVAGHGEVVRARGEALPLLRVQRLLGRPGPAADPTQGLVVLVEDQGKKWALLVDELHGQMQAVVKSLDANFRRVEGVAGATILGDGRVAMILDVNGLTRLHRPETAAHDLGGAAL